MVLLLSFLGSGRTVYASNVPSEIVDPSFTVNGNPLFEWSEPVWTGGSWNNYASSTNYGLYYRGYGYTDYYIRRTISSGAYDVTTFNNNYKGYVELQENYYVDTWCISQSDVDCINFYYLGCEVETEFPYSVIDRSTKSVTFGDAGSQYWNNQSGGLTFNANTKVVFQEADFSHYCYIQIKYKFRVYWVSEKGSSYPADVNFNYYNTYNSTNVSYRISRASSDKYYLYNMYQSLISGSADVVSAINSAKNQAASDADIAQSQAADIIDDLNYDHSGTSQTVSATQSAYDAAQGAADAAVDAAVHDYTSDLSTVEAYDYSSFFTRQRNSALFWRDVGEYILDSSNLGFVSGSVIIVTLIGLVIFMLRL